jgi:surface protein
MSRVFLNNDSFNQDIGNWDVSSVINMEYMFTNTPFNQDIGDWDVSNVVDMSGMFESADAFNQDIGSWDVSAVLNMDGMFRNTAVFNRDLSSWCVELITTEPEGFAVNSPLSESNKPNWGTCGDVESVLIPDDNFEQYLIDQGFDDVLDDYVLKKNIVGIEVLNIGWKGIKALDGIEHFENLRILDVRTNNLTEIDITKNLKLEELYISNTTSSKEFNRINEINFTNNTLLKIIEVRDIGLLSIDLSANSQLEELSLGNYHSWESGISTVDLSNNPKLKYLSISQLPTFSSIDLSYNSNLEELRLTSLTSMNTLNISNLSNLNFLNIGGTPINSIDLSQNVSLETYYGLYNSDIGPTKIDFTNNSKLKSISLRKGAVDEVIVSENNAVQYISFETMDEVLIRSVLSNLNQLNHISIRRVAFDEDNLNLNSKALESLILIYNSGLSCVSVSSETKAFLESDDGFLVIRDNEPEVILSVPADFDTRPPSISSGQTFAYKPSQQAGASIGSVNATDNQGVTDFAIRSVTGSNNTDYTANRWYSISNTGAISLTAAGAGDVASNSILITPNIFTLEISASDAAGNTASQNITLIIDGEAPTIAENQTLSYAERRVAGQTIATIEVSDNVGVTALTIDSIVDTDGQDYTSQGYYSISNTGDISMTEAGVASGFMNDFETAPNIFTLVVTARDAAGNTKTQQLSLQVTDLDENLPVMGPDVEQTYAEGQPAGVTLAEVTASDNESIASYEIVSVLGGDEQDYSTEAWYSISTSGHVALTNAGLEFASNQYDIAPNTFILGVVAFDGAGNQSVDTAFVILNIVERIQSSVDLAPTSGTYSSANPTLTWSNDSLATQYHIEIYSVTSDSIAKKMQMISTASDTTLVVSDTVTTNSITLNTLEYSQSYLWRVQPSNGFSDGLWTEFGSFTTEFPPVGRVTLLTPAQNEKGVEIPTVFSWDSVAHATSYEFELFTDALLTKVTSISISTTEVTIDSMKAESDYLFRVRAKNQTSTGPWANHEFYTAEAGSGVLTSHGESLNIPTSYSLNQNYPNPITGRFITTLVNGVKGVGVHTVEFDASTLSSGMYVYTLETDGYRQTRQMMLVK